jgi:hypothetical protein
MDLSVGLGSSDGIDFFWGDDYRWEDWHPQPRDVLELCEAIRAGNVVEETWKLGGFVIETRCYIRPNGQRVGDGSAPLPAWIRRLARHSVRTFRPWGEAA